MSELKINYVDNWSKKEVNLDELGLAMEKGKSEVYTDNAFRTISEKWKKYSKRGISNLYLLKEAEDDGMACAYYAYSISDGTIPEETLEKIRMICAEQLSVGEMRACGSDLKPDEWWDTNPEYMTKLVNKGNADYLLEYLSAELFPLGIVLTARSIPMRKADRLSCSAIAWGIKEKGLFNKGAYVARLINNEIL